MQIITHKNENLTVCQKLLHNPQTILEELKYCLDEFASGRIKHFLTIRASGKHGKALADEVKTLLNLEPSYLKFDSISREYLNVLLSNLDEKNFKKLIPSIAMLLKDNTDYLTEVINGVETLVKSDQIDFDHFCKIDTSLNILFSALINKGFSKGFLYKVFYGIFVQSLRSRNNFDDHFRNFRLRILDEERNHHVIFRIDTTRKVYDAISHIQIADITLTDDLAEIRLNGNRVRAEFEVFNVTSANRKFIHCEVMAFDYLSALKAGRKNLSEYLDVINLGLSDQALHIHNRVLVLDLRSPERGGFQNNVNILDGKYRVEKDHYTSFTTKIPSILNNSSINPESKEKIKSAVRYLRLGNHSTEIEHKFINYWIGLEYLFSNYESSNTINRLKEHFINAHAIAYTKRNVHSFKKGFSQLSSATKALALTYTQDDDEYLKDEQFFEDVEQKLLNDFPLIAYRAKKLRNWFFKTGKTPNAKAYLQKHKDNLEVHFTRIYRLRNEIIHDAAMNTNNQLIVSNLRYYLTFILNEVIDFLSNSEFNNATSIEDYFILNELKLGNIEHQGSTLIDLLNVDCSIDFIS